MDAHTYSRPSEHLLALVILLLQDGTASACESVLLAVAYAQGRHVELPALR